MIKENNYAVPGIDSQARELRWSTLDIYGPFVKSLTLRLDEDEGYDASLFELLDHLNDQDVTAVLPNLESLRVIAIDVTCVQDTLGDLLAVLMASSIKRFELAFNTNSKNELQASNNVVALCSVLYRLRDLKLETFCITSSDRMITQSRRVENTVQAVLVQQQALLNITVSDFCSRLTTSFRDAGRLAHLENIRLTTTPYGFYGDLPHPDIPVARVHPVHSFPTGTDDKHPTFPSLRRFMANVSVDDVRPILSSITSPGVRCIELHVTGPGAMIGTCFTEIGRFERLETIWLEYPGLLGGWADIMPILACHSVQNISVHGDCISAILGDEQVLCIAQAWPCLRSLVIVDSCLERWRLDLQTTCPQRGSRDPHIPMTTLLGLGAFAAYCPSLSCLIIPIDARETPNIPILGATGCAVQEIGFPNSLVDEGEQRVARFISSMWPNHTHTEIAELDQRWEKVWAPSLRTPGENEERWSRVWSLARELAGAKPGHDIDLSNTTDEPGRDLRAPPPRRLFFPAVLLSRLWALVAWVF